MPSKYEEVESMEKAWRSMEKAWRNLERREDLMKLIVKIFTGRRFGWIYRYICLNVILN